MDLLECTIMPYAWGSCTAIAQLTGSPSPSKGPQAELWMGAHPMAPAKVRRAEGARDLRDVIADSPSAALGPVVASVFGEHLPFLMKVLAAERPLSLQAHPNEQQARAGFDAEETRGLARDAPSRNYRDASHKPELLCALTPFDALCGFRVARDTVRLFDELDVKELEGVLAPLRSSASRDGLSTTFRAIMTLPKADAARLAAATVRACANGGGSFADERRWAVTLGALYPGDVGIVSALLLNLVHLEPGEAIYLGAGNLHAYLGGVGVEIMASSDNVLRGGLTTKHVDVPELMRILDFSDAPITPLDAQSVDANERVYVTPAKEFRLSVVDVADGDVVSRDVRGPEIVLCTKGLATLTPSHGLPSIELRSGQSAFVPAATARYEVRGRGSLYRATVNLL